MRVMLFRTDKFQHGEWRKPENPDRPATRRSKRLRLFRNALVFAFALGKDDTQPASLAKESVQRILARMKLRRGTVILQPFKTMGDQSEEGNPEMTRLGQRNITRGLRKEKIKVFKGPGGWAKRLFTMSVGPKHEREISEFWRTSTSFGES